MPEALVARRPESTRLSRDVWLGLFLPVLLAVGPMHLAGIWDPHELGVADLARRAAIHLYGAESLTLPEADNRLPTLGDLGRGDLPLSMIALSFRLFGLSAWAGRLPLALATVAGLSVLFFWVRRMVSGRAATYATLVASTLPLVAVHGRTMLGDAVTMAAFIAALAGLSVVALDDRPSRAWWGAVACVGLAAGFACRGALFGVAVPTASVGVAALFLRLSPRDGERVPSGWAAGALLSLAGVFAARGGIALADAAPGPLDRFLGSAAVLGQKWPTFDVVVQQVGHALFPWSAFIPMAVGRIVSRSPETRVGAAAREDRLRIVVVTAAALAVAVHALALPKIGHVPFVAPYAIAAVIGLALFDVERGAHPSRAFVLVTALLGLVISLDFKHAPEKGLVPYAVSIATFPEGFKADAGAIARASMVVVAAVLLFAFADSAPPKAPPRDQPFFDRFTAWREVDATIDQLGKVWNGNLTFFAVMVEAMLVGFGALLFFAERFSLRLALRDGLGVETKKLLLNAWWALPLSLTGGLFVFLTTKKLFDAALATTNTSRGKAALLSGVLGASVMTLGYYPLLAAKLTPKEVFATYERTRKGNEPLGLFGVAGRSAAYYGARGTKAFADQDQAFQWLVEGPERRFLALREQDLSRFNALFRAHASSSKTPDHNLAVLAGETSQTMLVSSELGDGEANKNPLGRYVSSRVPQVQHPLDVDLEGQVRAIGWSLFDAKEEKWQPYAVPRRAYVIHLYYRVTATPAANWKGFIHIDGFGRRFNGDHDVLDGKIPMTSWSVGDIVTDRYEINLEPNFSPGVYDLFFGFFIGDRRLAVTRGRHHENRIQGGPFQVR